MQLHSHHHFFAFRFISEENLWPQSYIHMTPSVVQTPTLGTTTLAASKSVGVLTIKKGGNIWEKVETPKQWNNAVFIFVVLFWNNTSTVPQRRPIVFIFPFLHVRQMVDQKFYTLKVLIHSNKCLFSFSQKMTLNNILASVSNGSYVQLWGLYSGNIDYFFIFFGEH